ncbi:MAG: DUF1844 domain-containing protein [candidate division Zixibacteria bacterium]|nr:DUF1844 domain-containing protein [candidate division Zixibacteria bacterium]
MVNNTEQENVSPQFAQLVLSFHGAAWQQMGKIANQMTGKVERNLEMAKYSIDILGMIEEKTKGNLTDQEAKILQQVLTELRMNYVEEIKTPDSDEKKQDEDTANKDSEKNDNK